MSQWDSNQNFIRDEGERDSETGANRPKSVFLFIISYVIRLKHFAKWFDVQRLNSIRGSSTYHIFTCRQIVWRPKYQQIPGRTKKGRIKRYTQTRVC